MSLSNLKVHELRSQLADRQLDTSGTKPTLVKRLKEAVAKDAQLVGKKRSGDPLDEGALRKMTGRQLRKRPEELGIATTRSKTDIVGRIVSQSEDGKVEDKSEDEEVVDRKGNRSVKVEEAGENDGSKGADLKLGEKDKNKKMVIATKKGGAVLDQWLSDHIKSSYHVLDRGGDIYAAILNQTNVGDNNNKFFIIQALESDNGGTFMVYNRWGRVGVRGQDKLHGPYTSVGSAISEFQMKFFAKTKNQWADRKSFESHPKCYTWLQMDYSETEKQMDENKSSKVLTGAQPKESRLEPRVAQFISLICNVSMMRQQMLEIGYNAEKLPLGRLSKSTILKGYDVLRRISNIIGQSDRKELETLSGEFYTVIPHDFGFKKMRDFVIDTPSKLKRKLEMVEALGEIEIATKLLQKDIESMDPLYSRYQHLNCDLCPVEVDSREFSMIQKYLLNTHGETHNNYSVNIKNIFKVSRKGEFERFKKFSSTMNKMLLWHGSRLTNWTGILSQGLRIAPPEAPVNGYMFGKGVYFADMFSKSANYCCASSVSRAGVLLLCEVALGDMAELTTANYHADRLPQGKLSTKGVGNTEPDASEYEKLDDVVVPLGKPKKSSVSKCRLLYNEYIVYNVEQIRMRYVVQVNFNFSR